MQSHIAFRRLSASLGPFCAVVVAVALQAQQGPVPPKALVPVAASSVAENAPAFFGVYVTLTAAVERRLGSTAFPVDQDPERDTGREVLVFAPMLTAPVDVNSYVTVIGEVVQTDSEDMRQKAKASGIDLPADVVSRYKGRPAILAASVLNAAMIDLAKPLLRPMTPEEEAYDKVIKRVGPAFAALRQAIGSANQAEVQLQAGVLKAAFVETESFWKARNGTDALRWAREARTHSESIERAAGTGNWEEASRATGVLGQRCQSCHSAYRERLDDGTYRIK